MYTVCLLFVLFVAVNGQAASNTQTECQAARERESKNDRPGNFVPSCETDGSYSSLQCHGGTQFCQCWKNDGTVVTQPSTKIKRCECILAKHKKESEFPASGPRPIGAYIPQCHENGGFKQLQCHPSTGLCWCVSDVGVKSRDLERGVNTC